MKRTAVVISLLIHTALLFLILPDNSQIPEPEEQYRYLSINAVLINNQQEEVINPYTKEEPELQESQSNEDNYIITDNDSNVPENISENRNSAEREYYPLSAVHIKPSLLEKPDFIFPWDARSNNITEAEVKIKILIDEDGNVIECIIMEPAGYGIDEAVKEMFRQARFSPAYINSRPVPVVVVTRVLCTLED